MTNLLLDARFALRHFARRPGVTLTMIVVLAIGMTVAAGLFSFLRSVAFEPAPGISRAEDLVRIRGSRDTPYGIYARRFTREELDAQMASTTLFRAVVGWTEADVAVERRDGADPDLLIATFVTDGYFELLDVNLAAGAGLPATRAGADSLVAVISRGLRERHFASDADAIGATLTVAGRPVTVVGVAPPRFRGVDLGNSHALWLPDAARPALAPADEAPLYGSAARLAPGVDVARASGAMQALAAHAAPQPAPGASEDTRETLSTDVIKMAALSGGPDFERETKSMMTGMSLLATLVLLVTGMNVSALQTGIAMTRGREIAMRLSLGASRRRIVRQLLTESGMLGLAAGAIALALLFAIEYLGPLLIPQLPITPKLDVASVSFSFAIGLAAGVLAGLSPALHASREGVASTLKSTGGTTSARRGGLQRGLVVAQVLLTQPLVVMLATLVLGIVGEYRREALQDGMQQVATVVLRTAQAEAGTVDPARETERLVRALEALPVVERAVPDPRVAYDLDDYVAADVRTEPFVLDAHFVAPGWFETMDRTLQAGRAFAAADAAPFDARQERPVIVGADLAATLWPGANPIGRRLVPPAESVDPPLVVVGVAETVPGTERLAGKPFVVYMPAPAQATGIALLVRLRGDPAVALREIRSALREVAPALGVVELRTLYDVNAEARGEYLMATAAFAALGLLALLIAAIGLYAVVAFAVTQRIGEIAVRLAVGARAGQVVLRTMGDGARLVLIGLVVGLPASLAGLAFVLATPKVILPVSIWQVATIALAGIATIAALATWIPARHAARVDPATVLRSE